MPRTCKQSESGILDVCSSIYDIADTYLRWSKEESKIQNKERTPFDSTTSDDWSSSGDFIFVPL